MADIAHIAGLVVSGLHPDPVPLCDFVTSTTHKTLRGPRSGTILCKERWGKKIDHAVFPGLQGGPLVHVIAAKAVAFHEAMQPEFKEYCQRLVACSKTLAAGLLHHDFKLVTGGTDNHMILVDLREKKMTGRQAQEWLEAAGLVVNKNTIPYDAQPMHEAGGIRIGTPSICTRGLTVEHMPTLADWIRDVLAARGDRDVTGRVRGEVGELCKQFPIPYGPAGDRMGS
jgi:glycine hydroxymethyltransferase